MKVDLMLEPEIEQDYAQIHASEITPQIEEAVKLLSEEGTVPLTGLKDRKIYVLNPADIVCFCTEGQCVCAKVDNGSYTVKLRLYELEERLSGMQFIRISSSVIANAKKIDSLELSFNGTICMDFKNGSSEFVSRRYVPKIKKYFGM